MSKSVSVIIPHYSDLLGLDRCLTALQSQTHRPDEIIVADNNSPQGEQVVSAVIAGRAKLVVVLQRGAGPARNGAVAGSSGKILAFTDSDCVPAPRWLECGLESLERFDFVGGAMQVLVSNEEKLTSAEAFERVFAFDNESYVTKKGFSVTANLICPRLVFDAVGGFRVGVSEDLEWCQRATSLGYRIGYAKEALIGHPARRTWPELQRKWRRLNEEAFALSAKDRFAGTKWLLKSLILPASAVIHAPKVLRSRALRRSGDRAKALAVLLRLRIWRAIDQIRVLQESVRNASGKSDSRGDTNESH